jgi:hypothetical protein
MCLDCGCGKPNDDHGDPRHITLDRLNQAAQASGIPAHEAVKNIQEGFRMSQSGSPPGMGRREGQQPGTQD